MVNGLKLLIFLGIAVGYVNAQVCKFTDWNFENKECPVGYEETFEERDSVGKTSQARRHCCDPNHEDFEGYKKLATACRVTPCASATNANLCPTMDDRYVNGKRLDMEEFLRDSCKMKDESPGETGLCCLRNSTEGLLATTMGAEPGEFPHQAKLKLPGHCGGTIYNKRYIVTAAHCIVGKETRTLKPTDKMVAIIGTNNANADKINDERYVYKVVEAIPHPKYSRMLPNSDPQDRMFNDIALLKLDRDIQFGPKVKALEIAKPGFEPLEYAPNAVIVGWGTTDTLTVSVHLQKANFIIRSDDACFVKGIHRYIHDMQEQLLCVGGVMEGKWSPTAGGGDSGGPAICRGDDGKAILCGVTSYGGDDKDCLEKGDEANCWPSVYAEVAHFHDWIQENAGPQNSSTFYKPYLYGQPVSEGEYEHQVHITSQDGKPCGGTLIAQDVVVTAAQCVYNDNKEERRGIKVTTQMGKTFDHKGAEALPGFKRFGEPVNIAKQGNRVRITDNYYVNDLAILKLNGKVNIDPAKLAELPASPEPPSSGLELSRLRNPAKNDQLMAREFKVLDSSECQRRMNRLSRVGYKDKIDRNVLCGVEKYNGGSQCDRELGGGLITKRKGKKDVLRGVQIFRLCEFSIPNGFMDVGMYADWTRDVMKKL